MALPPKFQGQRLAFGSGQGQPLHTIELYLDYVCPSQPVSLVPSFPHDCLLNHSVASKIPRRAN